MDQRDRLAIQPTPTMERDRFERLIVVALCGALVIAVIFVYGPTGHYGFVDWDDPAYVRDNPRVRSGFSWEGLRWAFTQSHASNWHPLTWLSHMVDCQLFSADEQDAGNHHLVSVALHAANSVLLLVALRWMTGALWPSALVAALFAVHPLRVESVAWISERKDVLSGFFFMLTLLAYRWYTQRPKLWRYAAVLLSLTLGLMAKPMLVTVPFVLLLLDFWPLRRIRQKKGSGLFCRNGPAGASHKRVLTPFSVLMEKVPLLVLAAASCLITISAQRAGGAVVSVEGLQWTWRLVVTPSAYLMYLGKTIWPTKLACLYPHPALVADEKFIAWVAAALAATLLLTAVTVAVFLTARRWPYLIIGWLWFLGMLVPVIGLMQVGAQFWADRYAYLPLVGVYLMLAWGLHDLASRFPKTRLAVIVNMCCVVLALTVAARAQVRVWRDDQTLFAHALAVTRNNYVAHSNLGLALQNMGRIEEAMAHYQDALRIKPDYATAYYNLGLAWQLQGRSQQAMTSYYDALRLTSRLRRGPQQPGPYPAEHRAHRRGDGTLPGRAADQAGLCRGPQQFGPCPAEYGTHRGSDGTLPGRAADQAGLCQGSLQPGPRMAAAGSQPAGDDQLPRGTAARTGICRGPQQSGACLL